MSAPAAAPPTRRRTPTPRALRKYALIAVGVILFVFYPSYVNGIALGGLQVLPNLAQFIFTPTLNTAVIVCVYIIMALGLNVVVGYAGLLDLGYVAFYAAGAYAAGWFASQQFAGSQSHVRSIRIGSIDIAAGTPGLHISPWVLIFGGAAFAALLGILIGLPTLRLRGDYLAIVTLGFGEILPQVARNGDNLFGQNVTNGPNGITPIDPLGFGTGIHGLLPFLPTDYLNQFNADKFYYWTAVALVGFTLFCCIRLRDSRLGRAWVAIREDETAAGAMGIPLMQTKTMAYAIGAFFGGMAGSFFAIYKQSAFPGDFFLNISIAILCMVILGGMGNVWGVVVGAILLTYLNYQGLAAIGEEINSTLGTSIDVPKYEYLIFGVVIVTMMLWRPQGLIPSRQRQVEFELGVGEHMGGMGA